jgi:hypothetical protein
MQNCEHLSDCGRPIRESCSILTRGADVKEVYRPSMRAWMSSGARSRIVFLNNYTSCPLGSMKVLLVPLMSSSCSQGNSLSCRILPHSRASNIAVANERLNANKMLQG